MTRQEPVRPTDVRCTPTVTTTEPPMTQQELELIVDRTDPRGPPDAPPWRVVREDDFQAMTAALARLIAERGDVLDALGNGADEDAWPPGLTVPQAVARLRVERPAVVAWLRASAPRSTAQRGTLVARVMDDAARNIERGAHRSEG